MAIDLEILTDEETVRLSQHEPQGLNVWDIVKRILEPAASLRLTVVLFALSIFLILAGTFAQVDKDIWEVIGQYFRCWFARIPFSIFFPPSFVPEMPANSDEISAFGRLCLSVMHGLKSMTQPAAPTPELPNPSGPGFWFPGGKLIGLLLALNLVSAHAVRFKKQATGARLLAGLGAIAAGCGVTWFIIASAGNTRSFQTDPWIPYPVLWIGYVGLVGLLCLGSLYVTVMAVQKSWRETATTILEFAARLMVTVTVLLTLLFGWLLYSGSSARPSDSSMRILWQLTQGGFASAALMAGCWVVFGKRSGIVLLHSGIGLMMFYELHVALTAVETQMNLEEGETTAFVHDIRTFELAVIDKSKAGEERVTAIPRSMVKTDKTIDLPELPFRIEIRDVLHNSHLRSASSRDKNLATAGLGVEWFAEPKKPGSGTDSDSKVDMAAAYVTLTDRASNQPIGTYLVGMLLSMSHETDEIRVGDKTFELALRPKRFYKPFHFRLKDVRKEDYLGTTTPRNYASTVFIKDATRNVNEEKTIWMNNPLRFANETFYQSGYFQEKGTGIEHTTLSVVANSGWMMPYVACMLVAIGMLVHFLLLLVRFLMRSDSVQQSAGAARLAERLGMKPIAKLTLAAIQIQAATPIAKQFDWPSIAAAATIVLVAGAYIIGRAVPPGSKLVDYDLYRFGQLPVVQDGRVKPLDSAAYSALLEISGRTHVEIGHGQDKRQIPAIQWLVDVISGAEVANEYEVFKVENLEVQETIGVKKREGMRYSRNEIRSREKEFREQVELARTVAGKDRRSMSVYQRKVLELDTKLSTFDSLMFAFGLHRLVENAPDSEKLRTFQMGMQFEPMLAKQGQPVFAVAPQDKDHEWQTLSGAWIADLFAHVREKKPESPAVLAWKEILSTYADSQGSGENKKRPQDFNRAVTAYQKQLEDHPPRDLSLFATRFEAFFNHFRPFTHADRLYVLAFVIGACGWLGWTQGFNRMAFWLLVSVLCLHTLALLGRIYISGRPPVTNLYSSAVFIGWGCVVLGLILELVFRLGIGNLIASVAGYATLLIADGLALKGDTFTVMQAVLDTNFWLSTHVTTITLGYATTYLAGLLGVVYVLRGVFTPSLTPEIGRDLNRMIYGTLCFSIFFSFVGTVLGGLWADDSWGRFWGWDPKENGALIIVLWNALVLHARWGGMVKERGMAVLAIGGNIFVSWSWWGVNELGAGLHSYGFTEGTVIKLGLFVLSQLVLIGIGSIPRHLWGSHRQRAVV